MLIMSFALLVYVTGSELAKLFLTSFTIFFSSKHVIPAAAHLQDTLVPLRRTLMIRRDIEGNVKAGPLVKGMTVKLPDKPLLINGDAVRLTQVVGNLINNAAKYTQRGGRIDIGVDRDDAGIRLAVRDNGIGIDADALERIFDLFSQLPGGHERAQGGLGVGLTLARRLVELHGGTVEARSEGAGRGAEIVVKLPAAEMSPTNTPPPVAPVGEEARPASLRILAVDDNVHMAKGLASILRMWGHNVRTAHDGAAALEVATQFSPEVVLLDLSLPRVDGLEVARRLLQRPERSPALMVSMSGFGQEDTRKHSNEAGFHHHLTKPFDMNVLRGLLDDCMRAKARVTN